MAGKKDKGNVTSLDEARNKKQKKAKEKRPCSFKTTSDNGNKLSGTAAFLVVAKRNGGIDNFIKSIAENALQDAINGGQQDQDKKSS